MRVNHPDESAGPGMPVGRIAGIDFGTVRIGIAIADARVGIASPYENYSRRGAEADAAKFRRLVADEAITRFVVGLPVHSNGGESQLSTQAREFGKWLEEITGIHVVFFDERFTSVEAEGHLLEAQLTRKQRRARLDMLAAQIMLTAYLESAHGGSEGTERLDD
jgi:putative Holliday junction resolvase